MIIKLFERFFVKLTHKRHPCGMVAPFWLRPSHGCGNKFDRFECRECSFYPKRGWYTPPWLNELYLIDKRLAEEAENYLYGSLEAEIERIKNTEYPGHDLDSRLLLIAREITLSNWHQSGRAGVTTGIRIAEILRKNFKENNKEQHGPYLFERFGNDKEILKRVQDIADWYNGFHVPVYEPVCDDGREHEKSELVAYNDSLWFMNNGTRWCTECKDDGVVGE